MNINTQLKQLTLKEKLIAMETLWDDLCQQPENLNSPSWHDKVLVEREKSATKSEHFVDWELAKSNLRNSMK